MTDQPTITPTITADQLGITPITLRRWCTYHAAHLSTNANPPVGQARRFSGRDLEVLKHVKALRDQGFSVANINDQLGQLTFAEIDTEDHIADDSTDLASMGSQEGLQQAPASIMAPEYLMLIERRFEALEASASSRRAGWERDALIFVLGLAVGVVLLVGVLAAVALWGGG